MFVIIGLITVFGCVIGGYMAMGGHLDILMQPFELVIIGGSGLGAYIAANPKNVLANTMGAILTGMKGSKYGKTEYLELLTLLYQVFKLSKSKGMLALESHVENPHESNIFSQYESFKSDHHATEFLCDYLRLLTLGTDSPHEIDALMEQELDTHHAEQHELANALNTLSDSFPALGIVAAVLGVIKTMTYITAPPEVLGEKIAAALVGTFLGILLCYGVFGPIARIVGQVYEMDGKYFQCMRVGLVAHVSGYAPAISIEFARKAIAESVRPTFAEVEDTVSNLPST